VSVQARQADGSAGDANYGVIGKSYSFYRQPDPRIAAIIERALGEARSVLNVGAGTGSYEPVDREVTAVEPSATMRAQRPPHRVRAIDAVVERLPFPDRHFDASMGISTVHQWSDLAAGLREMRRVTRGPVVLVTSDPREFQAFWLNDYAPEIIATEARRMPAIDVITMHLGGTGEVSAIPIPLDCRDGFNEAYYGRPEMLLEEGARLSCSAWSFPEASLVERYVESLRHALRSGAWDEKYGKLRSQPWYSGTLRLIVSRP
jgi:SAM-dependent methyltransferase